MKKHKEVSWDWLSIITGVFMSGAMVGLAHLMQWDFGVEGDIDPNPFMIAVGGFVTMASLNRLTAGKVHGARAFAFGGSWWKSVLRTIGGLSWFFLVLDGFFLAMVETVTPGTVDPARIDRYHTEQGIMVWALAGLFTVVLLVWPFVWRRPVVAENKLVVFRGRIFYPGEAFPVRPLSVYTPLVIDREMRVQVGGERDGFVWSVKAAVVFDLERACAEDIRSLSGDPKKAAAREAARLCCQWVEQSDRPIQETIRAVPGHFFRAAGLPAVVCSGKGTLTVP
ncbi:MAG: hypothetical protein PHV43_01905 [Candidatus Colwellbacteria bacterium]|nr:hypothetical protein [Candidatus Colwellbacteria bacterium]